MMTMIKILALVALMLFIPAAIIYAMTRRW